MEAADLHTKFGSEQNADDYELGVVIHESPNSRVRLGIRKADQKPLIFKQHIRKTTEEVIAATHKELRLIQLANREIVQDDRYPKFVRALGILELGHHSLLILEALQNGKTLHNILQQEIQWDISKVLQLAIHLTEQLQILHQKRIIHKDINPANIYIHNDNLHPTILDFSIASFEKKNQNDEKIDFFEGTLCYMAPEQSRRLNLNIDYRADFYCLGSTLYHAITGYPPFGFDTSQPNQLIHAHIAKQPIDPSEISPSIPPQLSKVILKLLKKSPQDRYQTAYGLLYDLKTIQSHLEDISSLVDFKIASKDRSKTLKIPELLFGRDRELNDITNSLNATNSGAVETLLLSGQSGLGKTTIVKHAIANFQTPLSHRNSCLLGEGKFDQFSRSTPFSGLLKCLEHVLSLLSHKPAEFIERRRKTAQTSLAELTPILTSLLPDCKWFIDEKRSININSCSEVELRTQFTNAIIRFIQSLCGNDNSLILFLDDIQWADSATLNLLEQLLCSESDTQNLLIIFAYRDNEIHPGTPQHQFINTLQVLNPTTINLKPLSLEATILYVENVLDQSEVEPLAKLVHSRTLGNPLFIQQFLTSIIDDGFLELNQVNKWIWDIESIKNLAGSSNVIDLLILSYRKLPPNTTECLAIASMIGNSFDSNLIAKILNLSTEELDKTLKPAISKNYLKKKETQSTTIYTFGHDRFQQAALESLGNHRNNAHFKIAKVLINDLDDTNDIQQALFIAKHSIHLKTNQFPAEARVKLCKATFTAGTRATDSGAYEAGILYLNDSIRWCETITTELEHNIYFEGQLKLAFCEFNTNAQQACYLRLENLTKKTTQLEKQNRVVLSHVTNLATEAKLEEAALLAISQLSKNNIQLQLDIPPLTLLRSFFSLHLRLSPSRIEKLLQAEPISNQRIEHCQDLMVSIFICAYALRKKELYGMLAINVVELMLKYGPSKSGAHGLLTFAVLQGVVLGNIERAKIYGNAGVKLLATSSKADLGYGQFLYNALVSSYFRPISDILIGLRQTYQLCDEAGDTLHSSLASSVEATAVFYRSMPLSHILPILGHCKAVAKKYQRPYALHASRILEKTFVALGGRGLSNLEFEKMGPWDPIGWDAPSGYDILLGQLSRLFISWYTQDDFQDAYEAALIAEENLEDSAGTYISLFYQSFVGLFAHECLLLGFVPEDKNNPQKPLKLLRKWSKRSLQVTGNWAKHAKNTAEPLLHSLKTSLLCSQTAPKISAKTNLSDSAIQRCFSYLDKAIRITESTEWFMLTAYLSRIGLHLSKKMNHVKQSRYWFHIALQAYCAWEVPKLSQRLTSLHPELITSSANQQDPKYTFLSTLMYVEEDMALLETISLINCVSMLSTGNDNNVTQICLNALIEYSGAQLGHLYLFDVENKLKREATIQTGQKHFYGRVTEENSLTSMIETTLKANQIVMADDAQSHPKLQNLAYTRANQSKSFFIGPLKHDNHCLGAFVLENRLVAGAFNQKQNHLTQQLAKLAASVLYSHQMKKKLQGEHKTQKKIDQALALALSRSELAQEARLLFIENISHELRTPLNAIITACQLLQDLGDEPEHAEQLKQLNKAGESLRNSIELILRRSHNPLQNHVHLPDSIP